MNGGKGFLCCMGIAALAACQPMKASKEPIHQPWLKAEMARELTQAKAQWTTAGKPANGKYKFHLRTWNSRGRKIALTVSVENNRMVQVEADRRVRLTHEDIRKLMEADLTVEGLFAEIESELETECAPVVQFDSNKGHPRTLRPTCGTLRYEIDHMELE